jgi:hypothetical protein
LQKSTFARQNWPQDRYKSRHLKLPFDFGIDIEEIFDILEISRRQKNRPRQK